MKMGFDTNGAEPVSGDPALMTEAAAEGQALLPDGAGPARPILPPLETVETLFGVAASELTRLVRRLEQGEAIKPAEASEAAIATRKALDRVQEERTRVEQLRRNLAGGAGDRALDLAAARDEIGRRLACLRNARGD